VHSGKRHRAGAGSAPEGQSAAAFAARCRRLPLRRPAGLSELCATRRFLLAAKSVTGQLSILDGGDCLADDLREEGLLPASFGRLTGDMAA